MDTEDRLVSLFAGAAAGVVSTIVTNPLDTLRTRIAASREATGLRKKTLMAHLRLLFGKGALQGASVGLSSNLLASTLSNTVYLSSYRLFSTELTRREHRLAPAVSAGGAVLVTNVLLAPFFVVRQRSQVEPQPLQYYFREISRIEGYRGFYRGVGVNTVGRMVEEGLFWTIYEILKKETSEGNLSTSGFLRASAGIVGFSSIAKLIGTVVAFPYNVVMTHLREVNKKTGSHDHVHVRPTIRYIYKADGVPGFYKGIAPTIIRSLVSKTVQIYTFELTISLYARWKGKN